jgi:plastocyanin
MKKIFGSQSRLSIGAVALFAILSISVSCTKSMDATSVTGSGAGNKGGAAGPGTNEVWIQDMAFNPSTITVTTGTTITWTNKDAIGHTATSTNTAEFDTGIIGSNGTANHTFNTAGTYQYDCSVHPSMTATVVVK